MNSGRNMPSLYKVAAHWLDRDEWPEYKGNFIGLGEPFCAGCGWLASSGSRPEGGDSDA